MKTKIKLKDYWDNQYVISLKTEGYDPFIDYLKGVCILFVILSHCMPYQNYLFFCLWGWQSVHIYFLLQVFHTYKKGIGYVALSYNIKKLFVRIIKPFLIFVVIQSFLIIILRENVLHELKYVIIFYGGSWAGGYYFWVYIQLFLLLPVFAFIIRRYKEKTLFIIFTSICIIVEIICSYINMNMLIYRLLFFRYIYIIYLGYLWVKNGIVINKITMLLSCISIVSILFFCYAGGIINPEPLFFRHWPFCHWICYFYPAYLLVFLLYKLCNNIGGRLKFFLYELGKYSYEIYLLQMIVFTFFPPANSLNFIPNEKVAIVCRILSTIFLSIYPVLLYKKRLKPFINKL